MMPPAYICAREALATAERAIQSEIAKVYLDAASEIFELYRASSIPELSLLAGVMQRRAEKMLRQPRNAVRAAMARRKS